MKNLLAQIQNLDNSNLSLSEIFEQQKAIHDDIFAHTAFGDVSLSDGETLKNLLNGIVKNKLDAVDQLVNSKSSSSKSDSSIQEIFAQKVVRK